MKNRQRRMGKQQKEWRKQANLQFRKLIQRTNKEKQKEQESVSINCYY